MVEFRPIIKVLKRTLSVCLGRGYLPFLPDFYHTLSPRPKSCLVRQKERLLERFFYASDFVFTLNAVISIRYWHVRT